MDHLTRDSLRGVWAAIATPFDRKDRFDVDVFQENVRRLAAAGVDGVYTTDSDGEFYAIELAEFRLIVDALAEESQRLGLPVQVGVTWSHTGGVIERLRYAAEHGILGAHVGHPTFMPMTRPSLAQFWDDVAAAVPEWFGLIHYNTVRCPNYLGAADYRVFADRIPNLVGVKQTTRDVVEFGDLVETVPELAHFTGEHALTPFAACGAVGVYSWFANVNARYMVEWYQDIVARRWERCIERQKRMNAFIREVAITFGAAGNLHGVIGKALTASSTFLVPSNRTRRPYLAIDDEAVAAFRRRALELFPDLMPGERSAPRHDGDTDAGGRDRLMTSVIYPIGS